MGQLLGSCSAQIVVPRCDTACIQEVAAVLQHVAFTHVIHAGDTSNQAFPFFLIKGSCFPLPSKVIICSGNSGGKERLAEVVRCSAEQLRGRVDALLTSPLYVFA
jgi:hypothetical protein